MTILYAEAMCTHKLRPLAGSSKYKVYRVVVGHSFTDYLTAIVLEIEWAFDIL
jgi:hypothetical protein